MKSSNIRFRGAVLWAMMARVTEIDLQHRSRSRDG